MMRRVGMIIVLSGFLSSCSVVQTHAAKTQGEAASNYGYVPLDPLVVSETDDPQTCLSGKNRTPLLEALPDLSIRFAVASIDASGGVTYGPSNVTIKGSSYRAILDYINADEVPVRFMIAKRVDHGESFASGRFQSVMASYPVKRGEKVVRYSAVFVPDNDPYMKNFKPEGQFTIEDYSPITIPIYIGIGLRVTSSIFATKSNISLSGLGVIGAQAELKTLSGNLTVQTLGINGKPISPALPLPNKLDQTTVENAILSIGEIRALLYNDDGSVNKTPRIVGLYSPIGNDPALINALYSELSKNRPPWPHRCK